MSTSPENADGPPTDLVWGPSALLTRPKGYLMMSELDRLLARLRRRRAVQLLRHLLRRGEKGEAAWAAEHAAAYPDLWPPR
jgi:hypothetical protein